MKLTHSQISEILSNYTSSSEGFVTLQSLIMNSLMYHERELFVSLQGIHLVVLQLEHLTELLRHYRFFVFFLRLIREDMH